MSESDASTSTGEPGGATAQKPVISIRNLVKRYGRRKAVAGIDLDVRRGEIFAFLGPNGAGKTTTVEILEGFRSRDDGDVLVLGTDPAHGDARWRERIGVVLQESAPEPGLSVRECVELYAGYYQHPRRADETIALVGLAEQSGSVATRLSGGQRRRLDVALALIGDPELIFLDEPTTGFDPSARRAMWQVIDDLRRIGKSVLLTTHYMDEAEQLADRIAVISAGRIVARGTPRTLGGRDVMTSSIQFSLPSGVVVRDLPDAVRPLVEPGSNGMVLIRSECPLVHLQVLAEWAFARGFDLPDLDVRRPTLEDVYLALTDAPAKEER